MKSKTSQKHPESDESCSPFNKILACVLSITTILSNVHNIHSGPANFIKADASVSKEAFKVQVSSQQETKAGENYIKYVISTNPSISPAKLGVEPYLLVHYDGNIIGVIHINNLYTQPAYVEDDTECFTLLKKEEGKEIFKSLEEIVNEILTEEALDTSALTIVEDTLLCFGFSGDQPDIMALRYFTLNGGIPLEKDQDKALPLINRKEDNSLILSIGASNETDLKNVAQNVVNRIKNL